MLNVPTEVGVYLCIQPTDMRRGFDGLLALRESTCRAIR